MIKFAFRDSSIFFQKLVLWIFQNSIAIFMYNNDQIYFSRIKDSLSKSSALDISKYHCYFLMD